jgi:chromate transporter
MAGAAPEMNLFIVYLLLLKATLTSFSGLAGLPIVRQDFVLTHHAINDAQLNAAVAVGRTVPGPNGLYVVCVGYFAAGVWGAVAGSLALMTPAFLIIFLLRWVGRHADNPIVRRVISSVVLAGAGLLIATTMQLLSSAVTDGFSATVMVVSFFVMTFANIDTFWLMLGAALAGLVRKTIF